MEIDKEDDGQECKTELIPKRDLRKLSLLATPTASLQPVNRIKNLLKQESNSFSAELAHEKATTTLLRHFPASPINQEFIGTEEDEDGITDGDTDEIVYIPFPRNPPIPKCQASNPIIYSSNTSKLNPENSAQNSPSLSPIYPYSPMSPFTLTERKPKRKASDSPIPTNDPNPASSIPSNNPTIYKRRRIVSPKVQSYGSVGSSSPQPTHLFFSPGTMGISGRRRRSASISSMSSVTSSVYQYVPPATLSADTQQSQPNLVHPSFSITASDDSKFVLPNLRNKKQPQKLNLTEKMAEFGKMSLED